MVTPSKIREAELERILNAAAVTTLPNSKDELEVEDNANDLVVGLQGRGKRHLDSEELKIIHVEIK